MSKKYPVSARIYFKCNNGEVVTSNQSFKTIARLRAFLNKRMESGLYLSCGATIGANHEPLESNN